MIKFLHSFYYFLKHLFIKTEVDVLFYYPQHFNRGVKDENLFFAPLYQSCKSNNKSYLIFEEPDRKSNKNRNNHVIPFDFVYNINTLHNLYNYEINTAIKEINRVSKNKSHITVESYRNEKEKVNLMYWQLTCRAFMTPSEWEWLFNYYSYNGDYGCIYFE